MSGSTNYTVERYTILSLRTKEILALNLVNPVKCVHLLFESVGDLQLHQQNALPHIQLFVQILKTRLDVLFDGSSLIGQLLEYFFNEGQRVRNLGESVEINRKMLY